MQDIRQSEMYRNYMQRIGWIVERIDDTQIFIKRFPLIGSIIKIQRPDSLPSTKTIDEVAKKYKAWSISLELNYKLGIMNYGNTGFKINNSLYLPTKTIQIDLTKSEEIIFNRFSEAKRRAVRKATKNDIVVKESKDIEEFIKLKSKDFWPMGRFMEKDIRALWESFSPKNIITLIAYKHSVILGRNEVTTPESDSGQARMTPVAGVLLLFYDSITYYWMVGSTNEGKKLAAPTLLVWEALKLAKKKKCKVFDFEGIYDERFHNATKKWRGFTKFKQGFGGKEIIYPEPLIKQYFRIAF